jgi:hypothetical protein
VEEDREIETGATTSEWVCSCILAASARIGGPRFATISSRTVRIIGLRKQVFEVALASSWPEVEQGMTNNDAMDWLLEVDGRLYHAKSESEKPDSWVAVVRVPAAGNRSGKLIIALGGSAGEATVAAEEKWQTLWKDLSTMH